MVRRQRGFTIAEVLTVLVIVGLLLAAIAFAMPLFMNAPLEAQSQVDNVESSALALYKVQRDARQSNMNGIFTCTFNLIVVCSTPAPAPPNGPLPSVPAIVMVTADNQTGQFQVTSAPNSGNNGTPLWQGFIVYWLTPNADGTSNELRRAFIPDIAILSKNGEPQVGIPDAINALTTILGGGSYETVAQDVRGLHLAFDSPDNIVDILIDGGDNTGNSSSMSLSGNSYVRN
jgi:prepilin-type N-terminal cleavage/methylation domain-containing protein